MVKSPPCLSPVNINGQRKHPVTGLAAGGGTQASSLLAGSSYE